MKETKSEKLKRLRLIAVTRITEKMMEHFSEVPTVEWLEYIDFLSNGMALRVTQKVWGKEVERQEHEYPADWWQAFKARCFPRWARDRYPVRMVRVVMTARELYPGVSFPEKGPVIAIGKAGPYPVQPVRSAT